MIRALFSYLEISFNRILDGIYGKENFVKMWDLGADPPRPFPGVQADGLHRVIASVVHI